jgi:hypothetical protein
MKALITLAIAAVFSAAVGTGPAPAPADGPAVQPQVQEFSHTAHAALFNSCSMCHSGVGQPGGSYYPDASFCATCHNGTMQPRVDWTRPAYAPNPNLNFTHESHPPVDCTSCHQAPGAAAMDVGRPVVEQCLACHGIDAGHKDAPASPCATCHVQAPMPGSHSGDFAERHGVEAASNPEACASCHVRTDCLDCHRPSAASPSSGYHPADFLTSHPVQAYARMADCSSCHNIGQYCQDCHVGAGLASSDNRMGDGYHDANAAFATGHGQAARQALESCVACHNEGDCVRCHFNANPHGPGWDKTADAIASRNPTACSVCHVGGIPGSGGG